MANALLQIGSVARFQGALGDSERAIREAIALLEETGHRGMDSLIGPAELTHTLIARGKFAEAHSVAQIGLAQSKDKGLTQGSIRSNILLGWTQLHLGRYREARAHLQVGLDLSRKLGIPRLAAYALRFLGMVALAFEAYQEADGFFQESLAAAQEAADREVKGGGLALLGYGAYWSGALARARKNLARALQEANDARDQLALITALPVAALILADEGDAYMERAVELYALASRHPHVANSRWYEDVIGTSIGDIAAATLPPDVLAAAQERGRARDLWETAQELLEELSE